MSDVPTRRIVTTFYVQSNQPNIVFAAYVPQQVYFPAPVLTVDRYDSIHSPILLDPGLIYSVVSTVPITTPSMLRAAPAVWSKAEMNQYTQLPSDFPERDVALSRRITASAPTTYGKVMAVQDWLHRNTNSAHAELGMRGDAVAAHSRAGRACLHLPPRPGVPEPERREDVQRRRLRTPVVDDALMRMSSGDALAYSTKTSK